MSQANAIDLQKEFVEAFNAGGFEVALGYFDPQIAWHTDPLVPEPGVYKGVASVRPYLEGFIRAFGAWHIDVVDMIEVSEEEVLCVMTVKGHPLGQAGGETQFFEWCHLTKYRDGKVVRIRSFLDKARAFEAVGLSEPG